jgi:predicted Zn-dependent protease
MLKIFLIFTITVFAISCATSPTGRSQFIVVSNSEMNEMGNQAFSEMKAKVPIEYNSRINNYVRCIANAVTKEANDKTGVKSWEVVVFKDETANAFALPGGKIGVHTGILDVAVNADQLAAILGHEVGHVIARHGAERVSQSMATQASLAGADAYVDSDNKYRNEILAGLGIGTQFLILLPFSRKHESEADEIGLYIMAQAGFQPEESIGLWQNMSRKGGGNMPEYLSTHPSNKTRISDLKSIMPKARDIHHKALRQGKNPNCGSLYD